MTKAQGRGRDDPPAAPTVKAATEAHEAFDLIVAEKPSVARDIAAVVGARQRQDGFLAGGTLMGRPVRVTWCVGHLVQLAAPEHYRPEWKSWRADTLPMLPEAMQLEPRREGADQWQVVRRLLRDRGLQRVINACDAGREGELIFAYAYELAGCKAPSARLWVSAMTEAALRDGLGALRPVAEVKGLEQAARARSEADWLVGLNATRAMTLHLRALTPDAPLLSVGRVQTPTLAILVRRAEEIERFAAEEYYQVKATLEAAAGAWEALWIAAPAQVAAAQAALAAGQPGSVAAGGGGAPTDGGLEAEAGADLALDDDDDADRPTRKGDAQRRDRLPSKEQADAVVARLRGRSGEVVLARRQQSRERAPLLYDLTTLQREANKRFKYSATKTLELAQALYEEHKLLTYPRTDSRHLSNAVVETLPAALRALHFGPYAEAAAFALQAGPGVLGKRFVDDAEVGDHHAILPTGNDPRRANLSPDEKRIFDLVARRLLGAFAGDAVFAVAQVVVAVGADRLHARGRTELEKGWRAIDPPATASKERLLPAVEVGDVAKVKTVKAVKGQTRPPVPHTEGTLLGAMERAGDDLDDQELARAMKARGLGTPATRAAIVETLIARGYVVRDQNQLTPSPQGRALLHMLPAPELASPRLTGSWEARLLAIAERGEDVEAFRADVRAFVRQTCIAILGATPTEAARSMAAAVNQGGAALGQCPRCQAEVRARRFGWSCSGCGLRIPDLVAKREVSARMAKALLVDGHTPVVKGFKSKAGKDFSAALRLDLDKGVVFDFSEVEREPPPGPAKRAPAARP